MEPKNSPEFIWYYKAIAKKQRKIEAIRISISKCYDIRADHPMIRQLNDEIQRIEDTIGLIYDEINIKSKYIQHDNYFIHNKFH